MPPPHHLHPLPPPPHLDEHDRHHHHHPTYPIPPLYYLATEEDVRADHAEGRAHPRLMPLLTRFSYLLLMRLER